MYPTLLRVGNFEITTFGLMMFIAFIVGGNLFPELSLETNTGKALFFVVAITLGPWLIVRSLKFNAANTAYRNVRLAFLGTWKGCFLVVIKYVLARLIETTASAVAPSGACAVLQSVPKGAGRRRSRRRSTRRS